MPNASDYITASQQVVPIVANPGGFLLPSANGNCDVSLEAICIAPDSDLNQFTAMYSDPINPSASSKRLIGVNGPVTDQINSGAKGLNVGPIVFGFNGFFVDPTVLAYFAVGITPVQPILSALGYFQRPPALPSARVSKYSEVNFVAGGGPPVPETSILRRGFWGRNLLYVAVTSAAVVGTKPMTVRVYGHNFLGDQTVLVFTGILPPGADQQLDFSMVNKRFDAIDITVEPDPAPGSVHAHVSMTIAD